MPSREESKNIRRNKILGAARALIQETGRTGFSMRTLADRSGVSLVTPYNLFGSKQAVMAALLNSDIQQFGAQLGRARKDPIDRLFHAVSLGRTYFSREPEYYKAVLSAVYTEGRGDYRSVFRGPRLGLWRQLVADAISEKFLKPGVKGDLLAGHLAGVYMVNLLDWISDDISLKEVELRTAYGFALALGATVSGRQQKRLQQMLDDLQKKLSPGSVQ